MKANIIIGEKYCSLTPSKIKSISFKPPMPYDGNSIKNVIEILEKFKYEIDLISYNDFIRNTFTASDIFIVTQWILNRFKRNDLLYDIKNKVNKVVNNGNHFILMHHFWPYDIFKDVLDIEFYYDKGKEFFQNKFQLNIQNQHPTLLNIETFLKYNFNKLKSDEFTFKFKENGKFVTLIQKIPKTRNPKNFISFGYQKNNNSYIFLIDIHNIGLEEIHSFYFDMLLNNTLFFLNGSNI